MDELGLPEKENVKAWYDGFVFGNVKDIYNPWSIINYLRKKEFDTYWANTSSNGLIGKLLKEGNVSVKEKFETLLQGGTIEAKLDEQIVFNQLGRKKDSVWSLLLASGYLKAVKVENKIYELALTNREVKDMFEDMVIDWLDPESECYNYFVEALLQGDLDAMNEYMNEITVSIFSSFDTGTRPSKSEPERFYHGFIIGMIADLRGRYVITSNRESGFGRYDVMLEPLKAEEDAIIIEFKVYNQRREKTLEDTAAAALAQIEEKQYEQILIDKGIGKERIRKYGFAFEGKTVYIAGPPAGRDL
jgi:hypothetical protein